MAVLQWGLNPTQLQRKERKTQFSSPSPKNKSKNPTTQSHSTHSPSALNSDQTHSHTQQNTNTRRNLQNLFLSFCLSVCLSKTRTSRRIPAFLSFNSPHLRTETGRVEEDYRVSFVVVQDCIQLQELLRGLCSSDFCNGGCCWVS